MQGQAIREHQHPPWVLEAGIDKSDDPMISSGGTWMQTAKDPQYHWGFYSTPQENLLEVGNETQRGRSMELVRYVNLKLGMRKVNSLKVARCWVVQVLLTL